MCLQVLFLGPALPGTFDIVSERLVVSPVLRTLTLKRVLPYVKAFVSDVCETWPQIEGVLGCHYSGRVRATTRDFRRAFSFAFGDANQERNQREGGFGTNNALEGFLRSVGLEWLAGGMGADDAEDPLARVPAQDFATLDSVYDFVVKYGLAEASTETKI